MAFGREIRLPFLSHTLVELLFKAPSEVKMQNGFGKYLLRKSMSPHLPESIVWRKGKTGFEAPQQDWMQLPVMKERIIEIRKKLINAGILNKTVFDKPIRALPASTVTPMAIRTPRPTRSATFGPTSIVIGSTRQRCGA